MNFQPPSLPDLTKLWRIRDGRDLPKVTQPESAGLRFAPSLSDVETRISPETPQLGDWVGGERVVNFSLP